MTRQPISAVFADRARTEPNAIIVRDATSTATAAEIDNRATRVARLLDARGVRRDDRVVVSLPNDISFVVACVAIWRVGATPMPLSPDLAVDERAALEDLGRPSAAFGPRPHRFDVAWIAEAQAEGLSDAPMPERWAHSWKAPTSSGSTGRPKVIASTAPALVNPAAPIAPFVPQHANQLVTSPLWHSTAFTYAFRGLTAGHRLVIEPRFDEHRFLDAVERHRITWAVLAPPSIRRLLRLPQEVRDRHDVSSLESVLHLGGRCPVPDKHALIEWLGPHRVTEVYAGSESNGLTMIRGDEWLRHPGSVGRGVGGTEIRVGAGPGALTASGTGTIWMRRGTTSTYTYLGARTLRTADGWDTLGDIGSLTDDGYLYVHDRAADSIHRHGTPVYPADIEQTFERHPDVRGAVAVGASNGVGGTSITVHVDIADAAITLDELKHFAAQHLTGADRPDRICLSHRPLRNDAGKIRRRALIGCGHEPSASLQVNGART
ncbi:AMP-binding protein [Gordonia sp. PKS22-38]|uniref:AMP-binding protein n=1 Tax=Gordonia prachuapensis TaxID=3115651 RepID=A0ABU7N074_9ACTN|nr:AMP-binding protein [Gordonia sp. PKS22-38]